MIPNQLEKTQTKGADFVTLEETIGETPLVRLQRLPGTADNAVLLKLEGNNPAGSVKDRAAINMIRTAERDGTIRPGERLVEATSGNTGIALAMAAALKGYQMILIMPANASQERKDIMGAYGAELIEVTQEEGMEGARDLAEEMSRRGDAKRLDQFNNAANPLGHYHGTGPEIWRQTEGRITHFVSSMGTTGTVTGCSRFFKERNKDIRIIGLQPAEGANIPGIRKWPSAYMPGIFDDTYIDEIRDVSEEEAVETAKLLARKEGIFCGISSGGAASVALRIACESKDAVIVSVVCDRGDRYLSTRVFG